MLALASPSLCAIAAVAARSPPGSTAARSPAAVRRQPATRQDAFQGALPLAAGRRLVGLAGLGRMGLGGRPVRCLRREKGCVGVALVGLAARPAWKVRTTDFLYLSI